MGEGGRGYWFEDLDAGVGEDGVDCADGLSFLMFIVYWLFACLFGIGGGVGYYNPISLQ